MTLTCIDTKEGDHGVGDEIGFPSVYMLEYVCVCHSNTRNIQERSGKTHPIKNTRFTHM